MLTLLFLIPLLPLLGFLILNIVSTHNPSRALTTSIGVGSVVASAVLTFLIAMVFVSSTPSSGAYIQTLWPWMNVGNLSVHISLRLDALSLIWMLVITFVGALIHVYSSAFMKEENDWNYARFFSYMNLFVGMMLILVLANNLPLLYLGWEGVGLASYLLIGFWYKEPKNAGAARKAFIVTRIGDVSLLLGMIVLFNSFGTLNIQSLMTKAAAQWSVGSPMALIAALLLLGGAVGKSAQLPLQIWLPDSMAGPTPVSALLHAATMVTAGVYLIARTHALYQLSPTAMLVVATIGAVTLLLSSFSAMTQRDIKRVLAYSTISQIGYMFLGLGVGAWSAAAFHFMVHGFFKSLLFLGAGVIILHLEHEHDMFKMGGLRKELPVTFWTFLLGANSLAAIPIISAGFYSKDAIIWDAWSSSFGGPWLWAAALIGAFLTPIYTYRMVFLTFFGKPTPLVQKHSPLPRPALSMRVPLIVLAVLSVFGGLLAVPEWMGNFHPLYNLLHEVLPPVSRVHTGTGEGVMEIFSAVASLAGLGVAYLFIMRKRDSLEKAFKTAFVSVWHSFWFIGWGFDWLYNGIFVVPYVWLTGIDKDDAVDLAFDSVAKANSGASFLLSKIQNGRLLRYALIIAGGAALILMGVIIL